MSTAAAYIGFDLPVERAATEPPEARGLKRDEVRLLVDAPRGVEHVRFRDIGRFLEPGDLVVVNVSATLPAAVDGVRRDGARIVVHFASPLADGTWAVELRSSGAAPLRDGSAGEKIELPRGAVLGIVSAYSGPEGRSRLVRARLYPDGDVPAYLTQHGRPITYGYVRDRWPLSMYQTVFARVAGSAEMPSAGRPFTDELVTELVARGVLFAPIVLHTGVSSLESGERPPPERVRVPRATARLVNHVHAAGGAVIAVGTTVARALESAAGRDGVVRARAGWTDLVLGPARPARAIDGLVTGWHAPDASHQLVLAAVAGRDRVERAHRAALRAGYLWHEFGDSCLFLPGGSRLGSLGRPARSRVTG